MIYLQQPVATARVLSGMRPTGRLHLGHMTVLNNWVQLQSKFECYFFVADWHALTTSFEETQLFAGYIRDLVIDWLAVGLDPQKSTIFIQSRVKEHAELFLLLSMITPVSWLERCPTYKDQVIQLGQQGKEIAMLGFLGYPVLMSADILMYQAQFVPVGEDQLPHLEICREIARRFNYLYRQEVFVEPKALLSEISLLPGLDGRKMSKSYDNFISLSASSDEIKTKVKTMVTDPARIHKTDPGHPQICNVFAFHRIFTSAAAPQIEADCRQAGIGCVACKQLLAASIDSYIAPIREERRKLESNPNLVDEILEDGRERATRAAVRTMEMVRGAIGM